MSSYLIYSLVLCGGSGEFSCTAAMRFSWEAQRAWMRTTDVASGTKGVGSSLRANGLCSQVEPVPGNRRHARGQRASLLKKRDARGLATQVEPPISLSLHNYCAPSAAAASISGSSCRSACSPVDFLGGTAGCSPRPWNLASGPLL